MRSLIILGAAALLASPAVARKRKPAVPPPPPAATAAASAVDADGVRHMPIVEPATTPDNLWHLRLSTGGEVVVALRPDAAPAHVARIKQLTRAGFYDGLTFHRVIEGFMAQTGDPQGTGQGGSPLPDLKAEFNDLPHMRGAVSMARASSKDSANSQFFITFMPVLRLDRTYTVFGRVTQGMPYVDAIKRGEGEGGQVAGEPSRIVHAWIEADGPNAGRVPLPMVAARAPVAVAPSTATDAAPPPAQPPAEAAPAPQR